MPFIRTVHPDDAEGLLARLYKDAKARAGRVFNVIRLQSLRPHTLHASTRLYSEVMHADRSGLSRVQREMIATAVSRANGCHYWTRAHGDDLRAEVEEAQSDLVDAISRDYRTAALDAPDRAMLDFAIKLTKTPTAIERADVETLKEAGFDDSAIHDVVQVAALFNYYNRIADGLGIEPEPDW